MFNVGDFVRVKRDLEVRSYNCLDFVEQMLQYRGKVFKVIEVVETTTIGKHYKLEGANNWFFNNEMLESITEEVYNMERDKIFCSDCGREIEEGETTYELGNGEIICEDCREHYVECEDCGELVLEDYICSVGRYDDRYVCEDCRSNNYIWCDECQHYFPEDEMNYDEYEDTYYCDNCWNNRPRNLISGYHSYHRDFDLIKASGEKKPPFYLGTESEMENENVVEDCIYYLKDKFDAILSHDGSLETRGAMEWVDDARSMKNHYEVYDLKSEAFNKLVKNGYRSHDTNTCGLHIHASRPFQQEIDNLPWDDKKRQELLDKQNEVIDRIILVMEVFKEELIKFSRRKSFGWCKWLSDVECDCNGKITSIDYIKKHKGNCMGHQRALNLENHSTIEFRIFKGTLNVDTYYASLELVNNIMTLCSDLSIPLEKITWAKLTSGKFVRPYVKEKHIWTTRKVVDTSEIDRIWLNIRNKGKRKVARKILKELNKWYKDYEGRYNKIKNSHNWEEIGCVASRLVSYTNNVDRLKEYLKDNDFNKFATKLSDTLYFDLSYGNDKLKEIRNNLQALYNELTNMA